MIRNFKKKHGLIYLAILFIIGFLFVSKCLETSPTISQNNPVEPELSIERIHAMLQSDSVITRRNAFLIIEKRKLKQFIPQLLKFILSTDYTPEDRRLSAKAIGTICSLYDIKALIQLLGNNSYKNFRLSMLDVISTYLDHHSRDDFKARLKTELTTLIQIMKTDNPPVKKIILEIITKIRYYEAFDAVFALTNNIETKAYALAALATITTPQQKPFVLNSLKTLLDTETNTIIRRIIRRSIYFLEEPSFLQQMKIVHLISDLGSITLKTREKSFTALLEKENSLLKPFLTKTLFDFELRIRLMSARIIGAKKISGMEDELDKCIAEAVRTHKGHKDYDVNMDIAKAALIALAESKTQKSYDMIRKYIYDPRLKDSVYRALGYFATEDAYKLLEASFYTESEDIKSIIANILYRKNNHSFFIKNIKIGNDYMRLIILKYISLIDTPEAANALKQTYEQEPEHSKWKKILKLALDKKL